MPAHPSHFLSGNELSHTPPGVSAVAAEFDERCLGCRYRYDLKCGAGYDGEALTIRRESRIKGSSTDFNCGEFTCGEVYPKDASRHGEHCGRAAMVSVV